MARCILNSVPTKRFDTAQQGLLAEMEMLATVASQGAPSAFLWQARGASLVLPDRFARGSAYETASADSAARGWPVFPRKTGGGITPQGQGILNVAIAFKTRPGRSRTIKESYDAICLPLVEALAELGVNAQAKPVEGSFCDGEYNLAVGEQKIVGTAQRWRGNACLCHALLITDLDLAPAVDAISELSIGLGHETVFDASKHCRLADLTSEQNPTDAAAQAISASLERRGFS